MKSAFRGWIQRLINLYEFRAICLYTIMQFDPDPAWRVAFAQIQAIVAFLRGLG